MNKKVQMKFIVENKQIEDSNVAGFLEGSDPELKSEVIVFTAHYDHMGIGTPVKGDSIYNGAADNASGTSGLIELAEAFSLLPQRPKRSLLFLAVTAEEKGLLGSEFYVTNPIFPLAKTVANFNLDMIGIGDTTGMVVYGIERSTLGDMITKAVQEVGLEIIPDELPEQRIFYRSDHFSFVKRGIPSIMPGFGIRREWFANFNKFYHQPSDDANLSYFNFGYMKKNVQAIFLAGLWVANAEKSPTWTPGDEFENAREEKKK
ncbi:M28 family peptidase [candidate division KSB1 bacterium]|nr:M28 family peptidase [candidate division KSB1 bacterium]